MHASLFGHFRNFISCALVPLSDLSECRLAFRLHDMQTGLDTMPGLQDNLVVVTSLRDTTNELRNLTADFDYELRECLQSMFHVKDHPTLEALAATCWAINK